VQKRVNDLNDLYVYDVFFCKELPFEVMVIAPSLKF